MSFLSGISRKWFGKKKPVDEIHVYSEPARPERIEKRWGGGDGNGQRNAKTCESNALVSSLSSASAVLTNDRTGQESREPEPEAVSLTAIKKKYSRYKQVLDANYRAGEKFSEIQSIVRENGLNAGKERGLKRFKPLSRTVESATTSVGEMLKNYQEMKNAALGELEERLERISREARRAARLYDALLAEDALGTPNYAQRLKDVTVKLDDRFKSQSCKSQSPKDAGSLHDLVRYLHESAIDSMFENTDTNSMVQNERKGAIRVKDTYIKFIDLDGNSASKRYHTPDGLQIDPNDIPSAPLKAMAELRWNEDYNIPSVRAIAAKDFVNAQMDLGCHSATVESTIRENDQKSADNNHITLKYLESKQGCYQLRADYVAELLKKLGFQEINVASDKSMVEARAKGYNADTTSKKLSELTRLLASSKNLDIFFERSEVKEDAAFTKELFGLAVNEFLKGETGINNILDKRYEEVKNPE